MLDIERPVGNRAILDVIQTISSNGESGRLALKTGMMNGAFFFRNGLLVDARVGNLTGFQAVNAAASMPDAALSFDPSIPPPPVSSITPSERIVLRQFFGIDTIAPEDFYETEPLVSEEPLPLVSDEEPTLVRSNVPSEELPPAVPTPLPYQAASPSFLRSGLMLAGLLLLLATTGVALLYTFGEQPAPGAVAAANQPASAPVAEPVVPGNPVEATKVEPVKQVQPNTVAPHKVELNNKDTSASTKETSVALEDTSAARDLTGKWNLVNTVSKTSYTSFNNMEIGFALSIEQNGNGFTGRGQKISENGRTLPAGSRTPIQVQGSINGDRVEATFYEQGTARKTNGRFVWRIDKAGRLTGTFNSTAARTSGKSTARKV